MKRWTPEEIKFLKFAYSSKDYTTKDIAEALGRSLTSIKSKAHALSLETYKEPVPEGYKKCSRCQNILPNSLFSSRSDDPRYLLSACKSCHSKHSNLNRKKRRQEDNKTLGTTTSVSTTNGTTKTCLQCKAEKPITEFFKNKKTKDGYQNYCKICSQQRREESVLKRLREKGY